MKYLTLNLPGGNTVSPPADLNQNFQNLGSLISPLLNIFFYVAAFLAFFWLVWGAFAYIMAQGQKENLAKARNRLTWAIMGLMVVLLAYFIARFVGEIFRPGIGGLPF